MSWGWNIFQHSCRVSRKHSYFITLSAGKVSSRHLFSELVNFQPAVGQTGISHTSIRPAHTSFTKACSRNSLSRRIFSTPKHFSESGHVHSSTVWDVCRFIQAHSTRRLVHVSATVKKSGQSVLRLRSTSDFQSFCIPAGAFRAQGFGALSSVRGLAQFCASVFQKGEGVQRMGSTIGQQRYVTGLHKTVSALAVKRPSRKKLQKTPQQEMEEHVDVVVAYAVAEELNLSQLKDAIHEQGLYTICQLPIDVQDALHVQAKYTVDEKNREIFFFRDGSAVFWSMPQVERKEVLKFIRKHDNGRYAPDLILQEKEEMDLKYVKGTTGLIGESLQLNEDSEDGHAALEKYAFSNALAQSVKLAIWESSLEKFVDSIEYVTEDLRDGKKISMSRREVLRKTGELFALRHLINLSSDLLDTPDFYWDRSVLEPLYMAVYSHLEIARRTRVMNEKLSHCCELTELLSSHLNDAHHTRLEVMIIVLIMVEVVFEIIHYVERYAVEEGEQSVHSSVTGPAPSVSPPSSSG